MKDWLAENGIIVFFLLMSFSVLIFCCYCMHKAIKLDERRIEYMYNIQDENIITEE